MLDRWDHFKDETMLFADFEAANMQPYFGEDLLYHEVDQEFNIAEFPAAVLSLLRRGLESTAVKLAITFGFRDENELTNLLFFVRHPERWGRKLQKGEPNFKALSQEWLDIRNRLVRPFLSNKPRSTKPTTGSCVVSGSCIRCGSCSACERRLRSAPKPRFVKVPATLSYWSTNSIPLDAQAFAAFERLYQAARADGIPTPYLKIRSGYRNYKNQAGKWRRRLLYLFKKRGCSTAHQACIASAIDKTTRALSSAPVPHSNNPWVDRFVRELNQSGCASTCSPRSVVSQLRKGTAPPGRSPHHTGRAVDLHMGSNKNSTAASNVRAQRKRAAFRWLVCNASRYGFYPYNREPWHWEYNPS